MSLSLRTIASSTFQVIARPLCKVGYHKPNQDVPKEKRELIKETGVHFAFSSEGIQKGTSSCIRCGEELKVYRTGILSGFGPSSAGKWKVLDLETEKYIDSLRVL